MWRENEEKIHKSRTVINVANFLISQMQGATDEKILKVFKGCLNFTFETEQMFIHEKIISVQFLLVFALHLRLPQFLFPFFLLPSLPDKLRIMGKFNFILLIQKPL